jgi:hypothetical protein
VGKKLRFFLRLGGWQKEGKLLSERWTVLGIARDSKLKRLGSSWDQINLIFHF